jgi:uncharacterized protein (TIRG00374 family)
MVVVLDQTSLRRRFSQPAQLVWRAAIRVSVSGGLVGLLLVRTDLGALTSAVASARPMLLLAAFGLMIGVVLLGAFRWQLFLRPLELALPIGTLVRMYFVGTFFNAFLPTGAGGDAYKAFRLRAAGGALAQSFASVLLDRAASLVGLALIAVAAVTIELGRGDTGPVIVLALGLAGGILLSAVLFPAIAAILRGRARQGRWGIEAKFRRTIQAISTAIKDPVAVRFGIAAGIASQGLAVGSHIMLLRALRISVPVPTIAAIVMISTVATLVPLTINGLGLREGVFVWALGRYGISHDAALAFAVLVLGVLLATSATGGIVYLLMGADASVRGEGPSKDDAGRIE